MSVEYTAVITAPHGSEKPVTFPSFVMEATGMV